ncbi:hypothetical protein ACTHO0_27895 [Cytobacillus praedii]|uniref:hypothetical protein n=1 Tax=Cytobacillus praedii TaxID=1742358 RepID=UPI003F81BAB9
MKKFKLFTITTICSFVIAGFYYVYIFKPDRVIVANAEWSIDITDKNQVVDTAENVFVGTVLEQKDLVEDEIGVYTPYLIKVDSNLKGEIETEEVLIAQRIGYDNREKALVKWTENDQFIEVGNSYVFSVTYDDQEKIHRIIAPEYGNVKVKDKKEKKMDSLKIEEYKEVVEN